MKLVVYGTLRIGEALSHYLPKRKAKIELITLSGVALYNLGGCPGIKLASKENETVVELWDFALNKFQEEMLLIKLDIIEGVAFGLYERQEIDTPRGKAWIYTYCGCTKGLKKIKDWKKDKHKHRKKIKHVIEIQTR